MSRGGCLQTLHKNIGSVSLSTVSLRPMAVTLVLAFALLLGSCGNAGKSVPEACSLCGTLNDVRGSLSTKTGSQAQMTGWVVAAFEHDSGIARVAEIDDAGIYTLSHLRTEQAQTLALFTPDYILQAVLSIPGSVDKTIKQFVNFQKGQIPRLINNGSIITFENLTGLNVLGFTASAQAGDGIPDGVAKFTASSLQLAAEDLAGTAAQVTGPKPQALLAPVASPLDRNGIPNNLSPDIDGDGLINWLDPDDNGNGVLDIFDSDQNSDLVNDLTPAGQNTDQWFSAGVESISVSFQLKPKDDGSGNQTTMTFTTKIRNDVAPIAVQVRGAPALFNASTVAAKDSTGNVVTQAWDRKLNDDGSGQRVYSRTVTLANAGVPRAFQVVFIQLVFGKADAPYYIEFPWTFPPVKAAAITAQYDANTHQVQLVGNPFGAVQDFVWSIAVYDSKGVNIWTSKSISGSTRQFAVQANVLDPSQAYKFSVIAQSLDKVPGHPAYSINSPKYDMK